MAAIKRVVADSGQHSASKLVAAPAFGFRQLREVHPPAHVSGAVCAEIRGGAPNRGEQCGQNGQDDREKQGEKDDMPHAPMEPVNPRKHWYPLLSLAQTSASTGKTRNRQSRRRR